MTLPISNLADQFKANREAVFEQLYRDCFLSTARMVKALGGNAADAEDIFQDSLLVLYEKAVGGRLHLQSSPQAYLLGIARNLWIRQKRSNHHLLEFDERIDIPDEAFQSPSRPRLKLFKLLSVAGRKCMDLLQAFYYQHLSAHQLAEDFGFKSARSATVQKYKCLEKVRNQVKHNQLHYEEVVE